MKDDDLDPVAEEEREVHEEKLRETARRAELVDLRTVVAGEAGRRVLFRILLRSGVGHSIMEASSKIYYNSGQQDLGHWLLRELAQADQGAVLAMMNQLYAESVKEKPS